MHEVWNGREVCEQNIGTKLRLPMNAVFNLHLCIKQFSFMWSNFTLACMGLEM